MIMDAKNIEIVALALTREFLNGKGFHGTLRVLDEECPPRPCSITSKRTLAGILRLEKHLKKNKLEERPLKTILEVLTRYHVKRHDKTLDKTRNIDENAQISHEKLSSNPSINELHGNHNLEQLAPIKLVTVHQNQIANGKIIGKVTKSECQLTGNLKKTPQYFNCDINKFTMPYFDEKKYVVKPDASINASTVIEKPQSTNSTNEVLVYDLEEDEFSESVLLPPPNISRIASSSANSSLLPSGIITQLGSVIFGKNTKRFPLEWQIQSFILSSNTHLPYGIVQKKGGPCGLLACVQAYIIKDIYFNDPPEDSLDLGENYIVRCRDALAAALSNILWKIGNMETAVVVIPGGHYSSSDELKVLNFDKFQDLKQFFKENLPLFMNDESQSCIMFLYSAILSRGIANIKMDMDDPSCCCFVGAHGYCTQEMINLLLTGKATSNAFNDSITLDDGGTGDKSILKGVFEQSEIGLLSLFEHYNCFLVGSNLKSPSLPIWIVCSESHFSVLFSKGNMVSSNEVFDLFYYDGLINQETEIKLTIDTGSQHVDGNTDLISPIEHCIRTKWENAHVNWNGTEPLL